MLLSSMLLHRTRHEPHTIERIEEFHTEVHDIVQYHNPKDIQKPSWELEAALRDMKNGTTKVNDHISIETLKAGEDTITKTLTKLYTTRLSERRISTAWKNAKTVIIFKKGNTKYLKNYIPICLLSNIYKLLTKVLKRKLEKTFDEK